MMGETRWSRPGPDPVTFEERRAWVRDASGETVWGALRYKSGLAFLFGVAGACLVLAWDFTAGPAVIYPIRPWTGMAPPFVGAVLVLLFSLILNAFIRLLTLQLFREMATSRIPMWGEQVERTIPRLTWWAGMIQSFAVMFFAFAALLLVSETVAWLIERSRDGTGYLEHLERRVDRIVAASVIAGVGSAVLIAALELLDPVWRWLKSVLAQRQLLWWLLSGLVCVFVTAMFWSYGASLAILVSLTSEMHRFAPTLTIGTLIGLVVPAAWIAYELVDWSEPRLDVVDARLLEEARLKGLLDYRSWDVAPETSFSGLTAQDYPFFLWRESADSRLGLARTRFLAVVSDDEGLWLEFYNPAATPRPTGALVVAALVGGGLMLRDWFSFFWLGQRFLASTAPYQTPPAFAVLDAIIYGGVAASLAGIVWHVLMLSWRWKRNRFEADGALYRLPLATLDGFQVLNAADAGALVDGKPARIGYGLAANFDDGRQLILTSNNWNHVSASSRHRQLTSLFRAPRDSFVASYEETRKKARDANAGQGTGDVADPAVSGKSSVPDRL